MMMICAYCFHDVHGRYPFWYFSDVKRTVIFNRSSLVSKIVSVEKQQLREDQLDFGSRALAALPKCQHASLF